MLSFIDPNVDLPVANLDYMKRSFCSIENCLKEKLFCVFINCARLIRFAKFKQL